MRSAPLEVSSWSVFSFDPWGRRAQFRVPPRVPQIIPAESGQHEFGGWPTKMAFPRSVIHSHPPTPTCRPPKTPASLWPPPIHLRRAPHSTPSCQPTPYGRAGLKFWALHGGRLATTFVPPRWVCVCVAFFQRLRRRRSSRQARRCAILLTRRVWFESRCDYMFRALDYLVMSSLISRSSQYFRTNSVFLIFG